jgi:hypothetical protein
MGEPVYTNFLSGVKAKSDEQQQFPHKQFASALSTCVYLSEVVDEVGMEVGAIIKPHGYELNFRDLDDVNKLQAHGYHIQQVRPANSNSPCLKVTLDMDAINVNECGVTNQEIELVLFDNTDNPWDATDYGYHSIEYKAPSCATTANTMLQWNLGITLYKSGQTAANAVEYNIRFTGKSGVPHLIGSIPYTLNSRDQHAKFNLKAALDKHVDSSHYYVTKVRLWNNVTTSEVYNHNKMVMYIDNPISYRSNANAKLHIDQSTDKPMTLLKQILEEIDYVSYVDYGSERKDDKII